MQLQIEYKEIGESCPVLYLLLTCDSLEWQANSKVIFFLKLRRNISNLSLTFHCLKTIWAKITEQFLKLFRRASFWKLLFVLDTALLEKEVSFLFPGEISSYSSHQDMSPVLRRMESHCLSKSLSKSPLWTRWRDGFLGVYSTTQLKKLWVISNGFFWIFIAGASKYICIKHLCNLQAREGISH